MAATWRLLVVPDQDRDGSVFRKSSGDAPEDEFGSTAAASANRDQIELSFGRVRGQCLIRSTSKDNTVDGGGEARSNTSRNARELLLRGAAFLTAR